MSTWLSRLEAREAYNTVCIFTVCKHVLTKSCCTGLPPSTRRSNMDTSRRLSRAGSYTCQHSAISMTLQARQLGEHRGRPVEPAGVTLLTWTVGFSCLWSAEHASISIIDAYQT